MKNIGFIREIFKGVFIGIANVIPGLSGATIAVSMGVYDKIINAFANLRKDYRKNISYLLPYFAGAVIGVAVLSFFIKFMLENWPLQAGGLFVGLILGGLPSIILNLKGKTIRYYHIMIFLLFFAAVALMPFANDSIANGVDFIVTPQLLIQLFLVGIISAAAMTIPGVSGSFILMLLGFYGGILSNISLFLTALINFDINRILHGLAIFLPLALGILVGIIVVAKMIRFLLEIAPTVTYTAILGLITASPFAIILELEITNFSVIPIITTVISFLIGFGIVCLLSDDLKRLLNKNDKALQPPR